MMAEVLGIRASSLRRWQEREEQPATEPAARGRPEVIPAHARWLLRQRYLESYRQWGPSVLAAWARRKGLGSWSPSTIGRIIADLRPLPPGEPAPKRYEIIAPGVLWSEDGAGFRERGRKKELVVIQDECARYKTGHRLVDGPATGDDVRRALEEAFQRHGAPLVLKRDGGSIFDEQSVRELLDDWGVVVITSPPAYPRYNGKKERSFRDIRAHVKAQWAHGVHTSLRSRIDRTVTDLNDDRPRPMLGGHTAREVFRQRRPLPDRRRFRYEVEKREQELVAQAACRHQRDAARRRAVEDVLSLYALIEWTGDVSPNFRVQTAT